MPLIQIQLRPSAVVPLLLLLGCGPKAEPLGGWGEGSDDATTGDTTMPWPAGGTTVEPPDEPGSSDDGSSSDAAIGFIDDPDGGGKSFECDLWSQDCPPGDKCTPWANDGGGSWNATRCSPIDDDPDDVGDACTVMGSAVSGLDSCVLGAMCWNVDYETNVGTCVAHCQGDEANPICEDPDTQCGGPRNFPLCLSSCCPVEQDCPEGHACYGFHDTFACAPDVSGETGAFGDACEFINVCDAGLFCAGSDAVPGCEGSGCCAPFCVVGTTDCAQWHPSLACVPWYEEGEAPPGYELTGACVVPA